MPRRHGWLRDYHNEFDWDGRSTDRPGQDPDDRGSSKDSPVNITININLGDILSQIASGKKTAKEALQEMVEERRRRRQLLTEGEDED